MIIQLTIPKDICNRCSDEDVYITKDDINKENRLFLWDYMDYKIYYIRTDFRYEKCIFPDFLFGKYYIFKYIEFINGIDQEYPDIMIKFFKENKIIIPERFVVKIID